MFKYALALRHALRQRTACQRLAVRPLHTSPILRNVVPNRPSLLPEFSLKDKVIVVSGGARGLGLVQIEALLEAGATGTANIRDVAPA